MIEFLQRAKSDRAIRAALSMLMDIIQMASEAGGNLCYIDAEEFAQRYNYNRRTFFRHRKTLIEHGYISRVGRFQVKVLNPNENKNSDTKSDIKCEKCVSKSDIFVKEREKEEKESNKEKEEREKEGLIGGQKNSENAFSSFVALPQSLNPFGNLKLTQSQLDALTAKHSETVIQQELPRVSAWLANQEPNKWRNHFAGLTNWLSNEIFAKKAKVNFNPYATSAGNW